MKMTKAFKNTLLTLSFLALIEKNVTFTVVPPFKSGVVYEYLYTLDILLEPASGSGILRSGFGIEALIQMHSLWKNSTNTLDQLIQIQFQDIKVLKNVKHEDNQYIFEDSSVEGLLGQDTVIHLRKPVLFQSVLGKIVRMFGANENNGTVLNLKRGLVSMFQFQQHSASIIENDVSGKCSVTYAVSQNQVLKLKDLQSCENEAFGHKSANKVFGVNWQGISKSLYSMENSLIKSIVSEETHVISLNLQSTVGTKITSRQQLQLLTTHTGAAEFSGPRFEEILTALQGSYIPIDLNAGPLKKKSCTSCPSVTDYMKTLRKKTLETSNVSTMKNFLKMVRLLREAEKKEIIQLLRKAEENVIPFIIDAVAAAQTPASLGALTSYLKFTDEKRSPLLKKFLYACAFSSHPTTDLLNTLTNVLKGEIIEREIQEIAVISLGAVLGKMCALDLCKLQEVELAKNLILERLNNTDEVSEIKTYLLALKSALLPETIPLFLQYTEKPSAVSAIALSALQRFPAAHIDNKVKDQMRRIFHQREKSFGETLRLAAADILINNIPQHMDIRNIILAIGKEGPEVSKYLASKIQSILHSDHVAKSVILQVLEDPMLNNYNHLSRMGSSSTYSGYFTATKDMVSPYHLDFLFSENGFLRQINSNFFTHSHGNQMHSLQVSIEAKGLQSFFGGDTEEEEEEEAMAGMSAMLFNVQLRPVVFFQGYSDLMEKFWAATGEPENILKGTILIIDHLQAISLQSGLQTLIEFQGAISIDISGSIEISLLSQESKSTVTNRGAMVIVSRTQVDASFIQAVVETKVEATNAFIFGNTVNFSQFPVLYCLQLNKESFPYRETFLVYESFADGKNFTLQKGRKFTVQGGEASLNQDNSKMCKKLLGDTDTMA
ncbi:microsomal triglyceride transfer protein large subunit-like [Polyodon spathula]|uniref:microsomal triglyceride transfer protein large subunit-like n=1 Tax=Polyodon spathula TaxID=7913 RepID=UPI001B7E3DC5|nr:microsomal triglyceride transfer protein large subunit-like [Polyodon spathula]